MNFRITRLRLVIATTGVALLISPFIDIPGGQAKEMPRTSQSNGKSSDASTNVGPQFVSKLAHEQLPVRLTIPSIKVNAAIKYVGLTSTGAMATVNSRADVAWFDLGPRPGELGSAVIAGHRGHSPRTPTVFDHLNELRAGDIIYVQDAKGKTMSFVVRESRVYPPGARAPEVFSSASGAHLNLITCEGSWDKSLAGFTKRIVIFTDRQS
jgi:LPXTG-site transpeptidase (sortase) family protein